MTVRRIASACRQVSVAGLALATGALIGGFGSAGSAAGVPQSKIGSQPITVSAMDNIWGAGLTAAPDPGGNGGGVLPLDVPLPAGTSVVSFAHVTGRVSFDQGIRNGPDGKGGGVQSMNISPYGGISGLTDSVYFYLVGVFLDGGQPASPTATLNFTNDHSFTSLAPLPGQVFFIGNGLTGRSSGATQQFDVPSGATDLYLGFADAPNGVGPCGAYYNNTGQVAGTVKFKT